MTIHEDHLLELIASAGRPVGVKELLKVGGYHPGEQTELKRALRELVKAGRVERDGKRFRPAETKLPQRSGQAWGGKPPPKRGSSPGKPATGARRGKTIEGIIHHHRDGFGFVKPIVGQDAEDLFIPPDETRKTLDNDQVVVEIVPGNAGRTAGRIVSVTSRTRQLVIGTYHEDGRKAWVEPREQELGPIRVPLTQLAREGDSVKVRLGVGTALFEPGEKLVGEVAGSLGAQDDHSIEVLSVAFSKGFQDEFPPEVMDEADQIGVEVDAHEARSEHRRDLRKLPLITIDGEDARDFDDAVFCEETRDGWRLVVAIADVSHYVREGTALDAEALRRATSVYLPGRVLPMLPERLSNGICSLKPDVDRLCMVADMLIDRRGNTHESEIYPAVMKSAARCTYTEVHDVLAGQKVPNRTELKPHFEKLLALSKTLTKMRLERGAIDFDLPEMKVQLKDDGLPEMLVKRERWESHRLVEECMLAANEAVARFFREKELPTVNRYHGEPDEDRLDMFLSLLGAYGITVPPGDFTSASLNDVLKQLEGHPEQRALNQLALRSMMQAVYSSKNAGHYGLGAEDYLHFTSPIRRYPDLLVHRLLKELWGRGKKRPSDEQLEEQSDSLEALAVQCSERERAAMQVEREVNQLYACLLVKDRIGEEHDGVVAGLTDNGFFVQLEELWVEGFVRGESIYPDFEFDQSTYRINFGNGREVKVGMPCRVLIASVNMQRKQIDFQITGLEGEEVESEEVDYDQKPSRGGGQGGRRDRSPRQPSREDTMRAVRERFGGPKPQKPAYAKSRFGKSSGSEKPAYAKSRFGKPSGGSEKPSYAKSRFGKTSEREKPTFGKSRFGSEKPRFGRQDDRGASAAPRQDRYGGEKKYRSQDRGGRFGKSGGREEAPSARPTTPNPGRGRTPVEGADFGSTKRFGEAERQSRRFDGGPSRREKKQREREAPPPQPWEKAREEKGETREEEARPKQFDARAVLDRLWKERGGGKR